MSKNTSSSSMLNKNSKIIGIQFSILSPEEIRKSSVAQITSRDTYLNGKPVIGGLFDPRMGVLEPGFICPTDGKNYMESPGYHGHIDLARPVYYIQFLSEIMNILKCVCFKCSKLKINKQSKEFKHFLEMPPEERWNNVRAYASKVKRCGEKTDDGCGCLQPEKIRKESLKIATLIAEWPGSTGQPRISLTLTAEMVLKIFRRISDDDVTFMGFSPIWSRPDWMICQTMSVSPPSMRPSVKHDAQQRSEDDLTHALVSILKTNKMIQEKIDLKKPQSIIDEYTTLLQYNIAAQIDNKIPGVPAMAQRSGRPFKSIKDRLNGKGGRMRGNLMAKRVDFSARSVITADPNISIRELGIPMKIAKNITKPVRVNKRNIGFLTQLMRNGDTYPGAKLLDLKNGTSITLRYPDRSSIQLQEGDVLHRHMMNGDAVLFNRQPTLHRMSMMCHIAKIMDRGDTFRMNVADTKPYNADFDGDEMNLHMPQDPEAEAELRYLAAVPYNIISPANNKSIIGIYQDSMLGCYQFTRENITFTPREAMNLLMMFNRIDEGKLTRAFAQLGGTCTSFEILSQIMPPLTMKYKTNQYKEEKVDDKKDAKEDPNVFKYKTAAVGDVDDANKNKILEIRNGEYIRGQMDKGVLGDGTKGLLHRTCNDYGNMASAKFIDDLQNIVTEYMKTSSFSVGISDLILDQRTKDEIIAVITLKKQDVKDLIDQLRIGVFTNDTGLSNEEEFETQVNNILSKARSESEKKGRESLKPDNRFLTMFNAGSKGSELNISQMTSCIGQQQVDSKRIPYGFDNRTLPHYTKFDDGAIARGFVESSYIGGLTPQELFFHAMGGRVGLIDTAVKTSTTGYIQRKLVKGLEDLMVNYDMTVRTNKNKIVQFAYGEDNIDTVKVETQRVDVVSMSEEEIFNHYNVPVEEEKFLSNVFLKDTLKKYKKEKEEMMKKCLDYAERMIQQRDQIVKYVFNNKTDNCVGCPVAFSYIINNVSGQTNLMPNSLVDITPLEAFDLIEQNFNNLMKIHYAKPTKLFEALYNYYLAPKQLLNIRRFNRKSLILLLETITIHYKRSIVAPGEMVGMIAGQSIGEVSTQMTLNTFHFAGVASKSNVTRGVPRIEEILSLSKSPKNPSLTVYLKREDEASKEKAQSVMYMLEHTKLEELVKSSQICFDPRDDETKIIEDKELLDQFYMFEEIVSESKGEAANVQQEQRVLSKWIMRMELNPVVMLEKNITPEDINFTLNNCYRSEIECVYSDYNSDKLIFRIRMSSIKESASSKKAIKPLDQSDNIYILKNFQEQLLQNVIIRGVSRINKVHLRKIKDNVFEKDGKFEKQDTWVLDTVGTNLLEVLSLDIIDPSRTISNDIDEVFRVLGIEAARQTILNELVEVVSFGGVNINYHNYSVLCDRMTFTSRMISISRFGINTDDIGPIAKASFEETPEMFLKAARHGELDIMRGISANVMCGQEGYFGTSLFQVVLDIDTYTENVKNVYEPEEDSSEIKFEDDDKVIGDFLQSGTAKVVTPQCSTETLTIQNNVSILSRHITQHTDDDYELDFTQAAPDTRQRKDKR
jgi:DNA-directed RNA polymerase II subunit RPB1